jgi:flavin reductase (DIM6/NTAB) family NADH-FMN oxidoreductase RutF
MNDVEWTLDQLWAPVVAVTASHGGRANGLISSTAVTASLLPESPRLTVQLARSNLTHDLVLASGSFAVHLLVADDRGLALVRALGFQSGHAVDKLAGVPIRVGRTGAPILLDACAYVEARVERTLESEEATFVLAQVVGGERLVTAPALTIADVQTRLPPDALEQWERRRAREIEDARRLRRYIHGE